MTNQQAFFDSNILIYAHTHSGVKSETARGLLASGGVLSIQVLNESANTLSRKFGLSWLHLAQIIDSIVETCPDPQPLTLATNRVALRLCERYRFGFYDGLIVASALEANCKILYTEDLHHGQIIDGLRIENPFLQPGQES